MPTPPTTRKFKVFWTNRYLATVEGPTYDDCLTQAKTVVFPRYGYSKDDSPVLMEIRDELPAQSAEARGA